MYIYEWKAGFSAAKGDPLVVTENHSCKTKDKGIDKVKSREEIAENFGDCISQAKARVPDDRKSRCYIFLAATAGMRLLE